MVRGVRNTTGPGTVSPLSAGPAALTGLGNSYLAGAAAEAGTYATERVSALQRMAEDPQGYASDYASDYESRALYDDYGQSAYYRRQDGYEGSGYEGTGYEGGGYTGSGYTGDGYTGTGYEGELGDGAGYTGEGYEGPGYTGNGYTGNGYEGGGYEGQGYEGQGYEPTAGAGIAPELDGPNGMGPVVPDEMFAQLDFDPDGWSENWVAATSPINAIRALQARDEAFARTRELFPDHRAHNDEADAFRHAYWNYLMTQSAGGDFARDLDDAHERYSSNAMGETLMDLYNNNLGRTLAQDPDNAGRPAHEVVLEALEAGRLRTLPFEVQE